MRYYLTDLWPAIVRNFVGCTVTSRSTVLSLHRDPVTDAVDRVGVPPRHVLTTNLWLSL